MTLRGRPLAPGIKSTPFWILFLNYCDYINLLSNDYFGSKMKFNEVKNYLDINLLILLNKFKYVECN